MANFGKEMAAVNLNCDEMEANTERILFMDSRIVEEHTSERGT